MNLLLASTGLNGMPVYTSVGIALAVAVVGGLVYCLAKNSPNAKELGRLSFFAGILVTLIRCGVAAFIVT